MTRIEKERRFIVKDTSITRDAPSEYIVQAYLFVIDGFAVRVRYTKDEQDLTMPGKATLTGKGPRVDDEREEYEVEVSELWARQVISRSANVMRKRRHQVVTDQTWEIDEFLGDNAGLWIAELEGGKEIESVRKPTWAAREIRNEPSFDNERLTLRPISEWTEDERHAAGI